jgi:hypothetical protein
MLGLKVLPSSASGACMCIEKIIFACHQYSREARTADQLAKCKDHAPRKERVPEIIEESIWDNPGSCTHLLLLAVVLVVLLH